MAKNHTIKFMNLKNIIAGIEGLKAKGNLDIEVNNISTDSRNISQGDMFVAIKGFDTDGHKYIPMAIQNGAKVILIDEEMLKEVMESIPQDVTLITAKDSREDNKIFKQQFEIYNW